MQSLIVQNIPDNLYCKIEEMAKRGDRNINAQILTLLESAIAIESSLQNKIGESALSVDDLQESANLYAEVYGCDRELQELTNLGLEEWPKE